MTKLTSPGWFAMSVPHATPGVGRLDTGKSGAATTYPAAAHAWSREA
jgi:hypothetical protein